MHLGEQMIDRRLVIRVQPSEGGDRVVKVSSSGKSRSFTTWMKLKSVGLSVICLEAVCLHELSNRPCVKFLRPADSIYRKVAMCSRDVSSVLKDKRAR